MENDVVVLGGDEFSKTMISILKKLKDYKILGYLNDQDNGSILNVSFMGDFHSMEQIRDFNYNCFAVLAIGLECQMKRIEYLNKGVKAGLKFPPIISPNAVVNEETIFGKASIVLDGSVVNAGCSIGNGVVIHNLSTIGSSSKIGNYTVIFERCSLSSKVEIGESCVLGSGTHVSPDVVICENVTLEPGSVVYSDITEPGLYAGNPALKMQ